jgi:hypothetical protein
MRNIIILSFLLVTSLNTIVAQNTKNFDFIITVDENIWSIPATPKMTTKDDNGNIIDSFSVKYHAGSLSMQESDYEKLMDSKVSNIEMKLKYSNICDDETFYYDYVIDFKSGWLKNYFFILNIYNTDRKQYRKIYEPLEGKNYTFEYDSSNGQMLRVTKKKRKKECCN